MAARAHPGRGRSWWGYRAEVAGALLAASGALLVVPAGPVTAADADGDFMLRGVGQATCRTFVAERNRALADRRAGTGSGDQGAGEPDSNTAAPGEAAPGEAAPGEAAPGEAAPEADGAGAAGPEGEGTAGPAMRFALFAGWIDGYLTAMNRLQPDTFALAPWMSVELVAGLVARHCDENPELRFGDAVQGMVRALEPDRLTARSDLLTLRAGGIALVVHREIVHRAEAALAEVGHDPGPIDGTYDQATHAALQAFQQAHDLPPTGLPDQATLLTLFHPSGREG